MRQIFRAAAVLAACAFAAPAAAQQGFPTPAPATAEMNATDAQWEPMDAIFRDFMQEEHIPGLVYGVVAGGRLVHVGAMGVQDIDRKRPVTADSLFRIASMSKAFTALSILSLRDAGKLRLDEPAATYVPEMRDWKMPTPDSRAIRVNDLLHHVAGFVTDDPWGDRQQVLSEPDFTAMLKAGVPFQRPPGVQYEYSNFGYATLGRIVANVSGMPWDRYIGETLLKPLDMTASGYETTAAPIEKRALGYRWENGRWSAEPVMRHGAFGAMGGLQTSATDYARYVAWLLSAWPEGQAETDGPLRRATMREIAEGLNYQQLSTRTGADGQPCAQSSAYGFGFRVTADCELGAYLTHSGGYPGYGSNVILLPASGVGVFAFTNRTYAPAGRPVLAAALLLKQQGLLATRSIAPGPELQQAYALARRVWEESALAPAREHLAMNFLMDRSEADWAAELKRLKAASGTCYTAGPILPEGALSGRFVWKCEKGNIAGQLILSPTHPPAIQALRLKAG